jgi:hypothetical protein
MQPPPEAGRAAGGEMIRVRYRYALAGMGDGRRPTLRGIARDRSAMVFITLAALALAAVLAHATAERLALRQLSRESTGWPAVTGLVVDTRVVWSSSPRSGRSYWPLVHYRYVVEGTTYSGDRVSFRADYGHADAEGAVAKYPAGSVVSIFYSPGVPQKSVLEPGTWHGGPLMTVLVFIMVAAIAVALVCVAILLLVSKPR